MLNAERRGEISAAEKAQQVDRWLPRWVIIPDVFILLLGKWVYADMRKRGYAHIEPEDEFVHGFVTRFQRERTFIFE